MTCIVDGLTDDADPELIISSIVVRCGLLRSKIF
jgi:hypothetical protein